MACPVAIAELAQIDDLLPWNWAAARTATNIAA
jgi:hypothetical protein